MSISEMNLSPFMILLATITSHNIALTYILGMCPFIALSKNLKTTLGMGVSVIFVCTLTGVINWFIYYKILVPTHSQLIGFIVLIVVIAASVQLVEMVLERFFPALQSAFGIFLPLITVNCTVLGISLFIVFRNYSLIQSLFFSFGSAVGWTLAMLVIAAIREKLVFSDVPEGLKGPGITMILAGIIALAFMAFAGMARVQ